MTSSRNRAGEAGAPASLPTVEPGGLAGIGEVPYFSAGSWSTYAASSARFRRPSNPDTVPDPDWLPLINTPSHPECPAGHPSQNGAAATILLSHFQRRGQTFTLTTTGQPSRTYTSIAQARSDGNNARIWGGMHYPSTVDISDALGEAIANYVNRNFMQPRGNRGLGN